jgi:hypothetical protein
MLIWFPPARPAAIHEAIMLGVSKPKTYNAYDAPHQDLREFVARIEASGESPRVPGAHWDLEMARSPRSSITPGPSRSRSCSRAYRAIPGACGFCLALLDDQALSAAIPDSNLADTIALAAEAGRRRLAAAVPSLETLCRRFSGFGIDRMVPEQAAALQALAAIGGCEAAQAVSQLIVRGVVQGPTLNLAVSAAARIGSALPADVLRSLLQHPDPGIRASVCGCARRRPELISVMIDLLDLNQGVSYCEMSRQRK